MPSAPLESRLLRMLVAFIASAVSLVSTLPTARGQNPPAGPVTGVIDGVAFEGDQYYVHGWACQEGQRSPISINIYANHPAGNKPPGTYVMAGTAIWTTSLRSTGSATMPMAANTDSGSRFLTNC